MSIRFKTFIALNITALGVGGAWASDYVVRPGETLSAIAHQFIRGRVYGTGGSLNQVLALNPKLESNPNLIYVGQKIEVPSVQNLSEVPDALIRNPASENSPETKLDSKAPVNSQTVQTTQNSTISEHTDIGLSFGLYQSKITSIDSTTGGKAILGSAFSPELDLQWSQYWDSGLKTFIIAGVRFENYSTTSATQTLSNHTPSEVKAEIGARVFNLGNKGEIGASFSYESDPFVRAATASSLNVDSVSIPKVNAYLNYDFYRSVSLKLSLIADVSYLGPASTTSYDLKSGVGYDLGVRLTQDRSSPLFAELKYSEAFQNTSITSQTYSSLGIIFGINFDVGSGK